MWVVIWDGLGLVVGISTANVDVDTKDTLELNKATLTTRGNRTRGTRFGPNLDPGTESCLVSQKEYATSLA